jgi:hypothetical protein
VWTSAGFVTGVAGITPGTADSQYIRFTVAPGTCQFAAQ